MPVMSKIARLVAFAHRFHSRIFVTLNTILHDAELEPARPDSPVVRCRRGCTIMQDMGILELDIPPIQLHASTQCDIRSVAKAKFLADAGFRRSCWREPTIEQIAAIHQARWRQCHHRTFHPRCPVWPIGQCNISHAQTGRSANRGDCSQACRLPRR